MQTDRLRRDQCNPCWQPCMHIPGWPVNGRSFTRLDVKRAWPARPPRANKTIEGSLHGKVTETCHPHAPANRRGCRKCLNSPPAPLLPIWHRFYPCTVGCAQHRGAACRHGIFPACAHVLSVPTAVSLGCVAGVWHLEMQHSIHSSPVVVQI